MSRIHRRRRTIRAGRRTMHPRRNGIGGGGRRARFDSITGRRARELENGGWMWMLRGSEGARPGGGRCSFFIRGFSQIFLGLVERGARCSQIRGYPCPSRFEFSFLFRV